MLHPAVLSCLPSDCRDVVAGMVPMSSTKCLACHSSCCHFRTTYLVNNSHFVDIWTKSERKLTIKIKAGAPTSSLLAFSHFPHASDSVYEFYEKPSRPCLPKSPTRARVRERGHRRCLCILLKLLLAASRAHLATASFSSCF